jgi:hypothetical protein
VSLTPVFRHGRHYHDRDARQEATASGALPVYYSLSGAGAYAATHVDHAPLGANDWLDLADHRTTPYDSIALRYMFNALDRAHAVTPGCRLIAAGIGG